MATPVSKLTEPTKFLSYSEIEALSDDQISAQIRNRTRRIQRAFIELGKMLVALKKRYGEDYHPHTLLKSQFDRGAISNASYAAKTWINYVEPGHITEAQFEVLSWKQCQALAKPSRADDAPSMAVQAILGHSTDSNDSSARGRVFENFILRLLRAKYDNYSWSEPRGFLEHGLDFLGTFHSSTKTVTQRIGVQVKHHSSSAYPTEMEWLKFLAGCFMRRVDIAIFITTGKLSAEQARQAQEAKVEVIQGIDEINRHAKRLKLPSFLLDEI